MAESQVEVQDMIETVKVETVNEIVEITYDWKDITNEFSQACGELQLGELLHDKSFGLFEAMSAIEMMDPKMDAGMMCNQVKRKVVSLDQAIADGLKIDGFTMQELIGIIDDTFACTVTWIEGHSLAQTVFTNMYMHNPFLIEDRSLKAFCICMLKMIDLGRDKINRAIVFEEEDFQAMTYGFRFAGDVTETRVAGMLKEMEDEWNKVIRNTRQKAGEEKNVDKEKEHDLAVGVYSRLKFCRLLFSVISSISKEKAQGVSDAQKALTQLSELVPALKNTLNLGIKPDASEESNPDYSTILGFEPLVNQRLLPPTFPRYTKIKGREETIEYLAQLLQRLQNVCKITDINGLHATLEYFLDFSKSSPCVLSRSLLQMLYLPQSRKVFGITQLVDVLRDTVRGFISPPALTFKSPVYNNPQAKEYVDAFLQRAVQPVTSIIRISCHNRARQRDKWGHIMEDLANLQDEADKVDAYLHSLLVKVEPNRQHLACFGTWVLYHTIQVMINFTLAGFELELYAVHEYHYIFWYLYECMYSWLISTLTRADGFLVEQEALSEQQQKRGSKKGKKKKKQRPHIRDITLAQGHQNLCGGYYKTIVGLTMDGKLKVPKFDFDSEEVRYNHRFAPFGHLVTPPPVQYGQFKEMTNLSRYNPVPTAEDFYASACKCFQQARGAYEAITNPTEEINELLKIAKTNFVVVKLLLGGHRKDSDQAPEFDFSLSKVFPVIKFS